MLTKTEASVQVRRVLQKFQEGYTRRDVSALDEFMELFVPEDALEVIGTNGIRPGVEEWYLGRAQARRLVKGDWEGWGDVALDVEGARIHVLGEVAWLATTGTSSMTIRTEENYKGFLEHIKGLIDTAEMPLEEKLLYILRGGTNTLYELRRGEKFVWPLRFTAVLVRREGRWLFHQVQFSLPTLYFPDVRD